MNPKFHMKTNGKKGQVRVEKNRANTEQFKGGLGIMDITFFWKSGRIG